MSFMGSRVLDNEQDFGFWIADFELPIRYSTSASVLPKGRIPVLQVCLHPPAPSPKKREGEPDWKSLSRFGRGI